MHKFNHVFKSLQYLKKGKLRKGRKKKPLFFSPQFQFAKRKVSLPSPGEPGHRDLQLPCVELLTKAVGAKPNGPLLVQHKSLAFPCMLQFLPSHWSQLWHHSVSQPSTAVAFSSASDKLASGDAAQEHRAEQCCARQEAWRHLGDQKTPGWLCCLLLFWRFGLPSPETSQRNHVKGQVGSGLHSPPPYPSQGHKQGSFLPCQTPAT